MENKPKRSPLLVGLGFTWWAVASVIIGGIIRVEFVTPEYEATFGLAAFVYMIGWLISVFVYIGDRFVK